jgi:DNA polymerase-3 subunit epsilon
LKITWGFVCESAINRSSWLTSRKSVHINLSSEFAITHGVRRAPVFGRGTSTQKNDGRQEDDGSCDQTCHVTKIERIQADSQKLQNHLPLPKPFSFMLQLTKPLAFIDLETTGINLGNDRIIEIAIVKILTDGTRSVKRKLVNPEMPIPSASSEVHGITDEMVKDAPTFKQLSQELKQMLDGCDLAGYNSNRFDIPLLMEEFLRAQVEFDMKGRRLLDVQTIFHKLEPRTLSAAYKFYCDKLLVDAHSAEADAQATYEILQAQIERYPQLGNNLDAILKTIGEEPIVDFARRFIWENGVEVFNFGKYKGKPVADVLRTEPQYYDWMMKGDFPQHTKQKLTEIYTRTILKKS